MKGTAMARQVGSKRIQPYHITIARPKGTVLGEDGVRRNGVSPPYMPKLITDEYHPTGNSVGYTIQTAHLMGSEEIYLLGFTLKSGGRYFFGDKNPVTKRTSIYDERRALDWLSWYESTWPGRARAMEGWDGPIYDVLQKVTQDELLNKFCKPKAQEWLL
jgi:hypothetical protein